MDWDFILALLPFVAAGFAAQLIDGALGMAFGVISSTLYSSALACPPRPRRRVSTPSRRSPPARRASATSCTRMSIGGCSAGSPFPASSAASWVPMCSAISMATRSSPMSSAYLAAIGALLVWRGTNHPPHHVPPKVVAPLGLAGGFLDAAGGGGWGPIVTGNLLAQGAEPRRVIGTVNTAEFLVTLTISATFVATLGWAAFTVATFGLLIGGVIAAPIGARIASRVNAKLLLPPLASC